MAIAKRFLESVKNHDSFHVSLGFLKMSLGLEVTPSPRRAATPSTSLSPLQGLLQQPPVCCCGVMAPKLWLQRPGTGTKNPPSTLQGVLFGGF